jgi:predicted molibdopterin-dependent oxidoreductase YjgC
LVQDIFQNETGEYADVILPAGSFAEKDGTFTNSDRRVQLIRQALPLPGEARPDWEIICDLAKRVEVKLGRSQSAGFEFTHPSAIWDEMAWLTPPFQGITYDRLEAESGVHWPCVSAEDPGSPYLFAESFPRGPGHFTPLEYSPSAELPDSEYPFVLSTGRVLYHWHGGTLTRRSRLDLIYPEATVEINPQDASRLGIHDQEKIRVRSRRGQIEVKAIVSERSPIGVVFIPFHFAEAAANELTIDARDPRAKIPDYKVCAVNVEAIA